MCDEEINIVDRDDAKNRLENIRDEMMALSEEADELIREWFPSMTDRVEAYQMTKTVSSCNPYDNTMSTLVDRELDDEMRDLEDAEEE